MPTEWPGALPWVSSEPWFELHFTLFFLLPYLALMKQESDKVYEEALQRIINAVIFLIIIMYHLPLNIYLHFSVFS